jgi:hypothetical protein
MQFRSELESLGDKVDYSGIRPLASHIAGILKRVLRLDYGLNEERTLYTTDQQGNRTLTSARSRILLAFQNTVNAEIGIFILREF